MGALSLNPYEGVDWGATRYPGITHMHAKTQSVLEDFYNQGVRVAAVSNYYPENPTPPETYTSIPAGMILVDNTEQHSCTDTVLHFCPVGSSYANESGTNVPWRDAFDAALAALNDPDGGGIVLNHPNASGGLSTGLIRTMLDHDPRVLGIEVYNHMVVNHYSPPTSDSAFYKWDDALASGRRCWGFFSHDHYLSAYVPYQGFNMLILDELTPEAAARAYRDGHFYGSMKGTGLTLSSVAVDGREVTVTTSDATTLRMVSNAGTESVSAAAHTFTVPHSASYARFEAQNAADLIYTQPVMYAAERVTGRKARNRNFVLS